MNTTALWSDQVPDKDGVRSPINGVAISPGRVALPWIVSALKIYLQMERKQ
jgi:hypothetical protein